MKKLIWLLMLVAPQVWGANTANVRWGAVTQATDGSSLTGVTYSVYQGVQGAAKVKVATGLAVLQYNVTAGLASGTTVCYEVTATAGGQESARSAEACKTFPPSIPNAPTGVVVD